MTGARWRERLAGRRDRAHRKGDTGFRSPQGAQQHTADQIPIQSQERPSADAQSQPEVGVMFQYTRDELGLAVEAE